MFQFKVLFVGLQLLHPGTRLLSSRKGNKTQRDEVSALRSKPFAVQGAQVSKKGKVPPIVQALVNIGGRT
jgi:hypothetical protein